ncbi:MAG: hypothetical protein WD294_15515 [Phycisphaeraceae bacterium]
MTTPPTFSRIRSGVWIASLLVASVLLTGCGSYAFQGRVIHGSNPEIVVVDRDDARLEGSGVPGASVRLTLDPESLGRKILPGQTTRPDGTFSIPVDEFGAGTLEYNAGLLVRKDGHEAAHSNFPLPRSNERVLIVLPRGNDTYSEPDNPLDDLDRFAPN